MCACACAKESKKRDLHIGKRDLHIGKRDLHMGKRDLLSRKRVRTQTLSHARPALTGTKKAALYDLLIPSPQREQIQAAINQAAPPPLSSPPLRPSSTNVLPQLLTSSQQQPPSMRLGHKVPPPQASALALGVTVAKTRAARGNRFLPQEHYGALPADGSFMSHRQTLPMELGVESDSDFGEDASVVAVSPYFGPQHDLLPQNIPGLQSRSFLGPTGGGGGEGGGVRVAGAGDPCSMNEIKAQHVAMVHMRGSAHVARALRAGLSEALGACSGVLRSGGGSHGPLLRIVLSMPKDLSQAQDLGSLFQELLTLIPSGVLLPIEVQDGGQTLKSHGASCNSTGAFGEQEEPHADLDVALISLVVGS